MFMAIFSKPNTNKNCNQARKGACFSITMPYEVEARLKEIQKQMGLNSRSQTIVFLVHHYEREQKTFDSIDRLANLLSQVERLKSSDIATQGELPYNNK